MCRLVYTKDGKENRIRFALPPNGTSEPDSWEDFTAGVTGYVEVDGYNKNAHFEILENGRYRTWFE